LAGGYKNHGSAWGVMVNNEQPTDDDDLTSEEIISGEIRARGFVIFIVGLVGTIFMVLTPYIEARMKVDFLHVWPGFIMLSITFVEIGLLDMILGRPFNFRDKTTGKLNVAGKGLVALLVTTGVAGYIGLDYLWSTMGYTGGLVDTVKHIF
jgi:hypothetical protein